MANKEIKNRINNTVEQFNLEIDFIHNDSITEKEKGEKNIVVQTNKLKISFETVLMAL